MKWEKIKQEGLIPGIVEAYYFGTPLLAVHLYKYPGHWHIECEDLGLDQEMTSEDMSAEEAQDMAARWINTSMAHQQEIINEWRQLGFIKNMDQSMGGLMDRALEAVGPVPDATRFIQAAQDTADRIRLAQEMAINDRAAQEAVDALTRQWGAKQGPQLGAHGTRPTHEVTRALRSMKATHIHTHRMVGMIEALAWVLGEECTPIQKALELYEKLGPGPRTEKGGKGETHGSVNP